MSKTALLSVVLSVTLSVLATWLYVRWRLGLYEAEPILVAHPPEEHGRY